MFNIQEGTEKERCDGFVLTCICLNALEFFFIDVAEEWMASFVSCVVAALSYVTSLSLNKTNKNKQSLDFSVTLSKTGHILS